MKLQNETIALLIDLNPELEETSGLARMKRATDECGSRSWEFVTNQSTFEFKTGSGFYCTVDPLAGSRPQKFRVKPYSACASQNLS